MNMRSSTATAAFGGGDTNRFQTQMMRISQQNPIMSPQEESEAQRQQNNLMEEYASAGFTESKSNTPRPVSQDCTPIARTRVDSDGMIVQQNIRLGNVDQHQHP